MKTDDLIDMLGTNVERIDRKSMFRTIGAAIGVGALVSVIITLVALGFRGDPITTRATTFLLGKLVFTVLTVVLATVILTRMARPGGERRVSVVWIVSPFAAIVVLAAISLASASSEHWQRMIVGDQWLECLLSIPVIAVVPFATIIWVLRQMAPTDLVRAGAAGGLLAGAVSATGYALHCMDDSLPFIALWYGGTIALCTLAGALLGPKLLRW